MPEVLDQTAGAGVPAGGAQPSPQPSGDPGGAQPQGGQPQPGAQPQGGQPGGDGIRQLREQYEGLKAKYEPWEKLGVQPDQVKQFQGGYQQVYGEVSNIAQQLGYSEQDLTEAIQAKGILPVLDFLRNQYWEEQQAQQGNQTVLDQRALQEQMESIADRVLSPIQQRENQRMTQEANSLFERTVHQLATDLFKKEGIDYNTLSEDEKFFILSGVSEVMKYEEADIKALKFEGKTAGVQKAFQEFVNAWDKAYVARSSRERGRLAPPGQPGQPQPQAGKRPSLEDMINDPSTIDAAQGRSGANRKYV